MQVNNKTQPPCSRGLHVKEFPNYLPGAWKSFQIQLVLTHHTSHKNPSGERRFITLIHSDLVSRSRSLCSAGRLPLWCQRWNAHSAEGPVWTDRERCTLITYPSLSEVTHALTPIQACTVCQANPITLRFTLNLVTNIHKQLCTQGAIYSLNLEFSTEKDQSNTGPLWQYAGFFSWKLN